MLCNNAKNYMVRVILQKTIGFNLPGRGQLTINETKSDFVRPSQTVDAKD